MGGGRLDYIVMRAMKTALQCIDLNNGNVKLNLAIVQLGEH